MTAATSGAGPAGPAPRSNTEVTPMPQNRHDTPPPTPRHNLPYWVTWADPLTSRGWAPDSVEVERWWTPRVGPTAMAALRCVTRELRACGPHTILAGDLAWQVGTNRSAMLLRALERLDRYALARVRERPGGTELAVYPVVVPPRSRRFVDAVPERWLPEYATAMSAWPDR